MGNCTNISCITLEPMSDTVCSDVNIHVPMEYKMARESLFLVSLLAHFEENSGGLLSNYILVFITLDVRYWVQV